METKWIKIWKSRDYACGIFNNCSQRVYAHKNKSGKLKIEVDGILWVGNTGSFNTEKFFAKDEAAEKLILLINEYDADEASDRDVSDLVDEIVVKIIS